MLGRWWRYKWITFHPSLTIICTECRKSEVMQRILAFYQGNFSDATRLKSICSDVNYHYRGAG
ncbi:hypothetical protein CFI09_14335 [Escherichia coli]|nr:hypothetical protein CFI09_14335 [Escherichia coli]